MLKRLLFGLVKGALIGAALAAIVVKGLGMVTWTTLFAFLFAAAAGILTALLTGKPIWASDAKVENGIKAVVGVIIGCVAMFGLRKWVGVDLDLNQLQAGAGRMGDLPAAALPAVSMLLALLFEIDNTGAESEDELSQKRMRLVEERKKRVGIEDAELAEDELEAAGAGAKARQRN